MSEQASVEATRAALHMREVEGQCQDALWDIDLAIADVKDLMKRGEVSGE